MLKIIFTVSLTFVLSSFMTETPTKLRPDLQKYCETLPQEFSQITEERKADLHEIGDFVVKKLKANEPVNLTYICTHNSRRSQFGQVWAKVAAAYYGLNDKQIQTFSGGTEATAFNARAVAALQRICFAIETDKDPKNPNYTVKFSEANAPLKTFSKVYKDQANPQKNFCAVMVCSQADEACPIVYGAEARVSLPYEDPKNSDGRPNETQAYNETCRLIAREAFYVFDYAHKQLAE